MVTHYSSILRAHARSGKALSKSGKILRRRISAGLILICNDCPSPTRARKTSAAPSKCFCEPALPFGRYGQLLGRGCEDGLDEQPPEPTGTKIFRTERGAPGNSCQSCVRPNEVDFGAVVPQRKS